MSATPTPSAADIRADVARCLADVINHNRTIDWVLEKRARWPHNAETQALLYGTTRKYFTLEKSVAARLKKPLRSKDQDLMCLLLVGAYLLIESHKPDHAIVNETVAATRLLRKPWASGLINAVLRSIQRDPSPIPELSFDHPEWLLTSLRQQYAETWEHIVTANNSRAPMALRVNVSKKTVDEYSEALRDRQIAFATGPAPESLVLETPVVAATLPEWLAGTVAVQDCGAQFAAHLLLDALSQAQQANSRGIAAQLHLLDACAAPGGKLAHVLDLMARQNRDHQTVALEISEQRIESTTQLLGRQGYAQPLTKGDACELAWWNETPFDGILLDAPCSGTGTIRRHPDIKLLLTEAAVAAHCVTQQQMLNNLWRTLAPGGTLLYCTCSVLEAENDNVIRHFLASDSNHADVLDIELPYGIATEFGWQLLPTNDTTDGFFYALLQKPDNA